MSRLPRNQIVVGDVRQRLSQLPTASVDCVLTSPPYFLLRDYQMRDQIGLEASVDDWVDELRLVMRGVARVLKPTGALWLNLGDSYSRHPRFGAPAKSLLCGPERLLLAMSEDGWIVRNKVIWAKPNPMPASVTDRLNTTYEVIYFMVRSPRYEFDLDAIRVPHRSAPSTHPKSGGQPVSNRRPTWAGPLAGSNSGLSKLKASGRVGNPKGANPGDVWRIATSGFRGAHFATFPVPLLYRPILATCPEAICTRCKTALRREATLRPASPVPNSLAAKYPATWMTFRKAQAAQPCNCGAPTKPGVVLDPFMGSGSVAIAAEHLGRDWVGIELNPAYAQLAAQRIAEVRRKHKEDTMRDAA